MVEKGEIKMKRKNMLMEMFSHKLHEDDGIDIDFDDDKEEDDGIDIDFDDDKEEEDDKKAWRKQMIKARAESGVGKKKDVSDVIDDEEDDYVGDTKEVDRRIGSLVSAPWKEMLDRMFGGPGKADQYVSELMADGYSSNDIARDIQIMIDLYKKKE